MLNPADVNKIVGEAISDRFRAMDLVRVESEPMTDSDGRDALDVTLVLAGRSTIDAIGDEVLDVIVEVQHGLQRSGEDRFAVVHFVTEDELKADADPE